MIAKVSLQESLKISYEAIELNIQLGYATTPSKIKLLTPMGIGALQSPPPYGLHSKSFFNINVVKSNSVIPR